MKILVTGREGQLARSLAEGIGRYPTIRMTSLGRPEVDLEVPGSAERAILRARPDIVINAAAFTDVDGAEEQPQRAQRVNAEAAGEVAAAAATVGAAIIQLSTDYVFDGTYARAYDEDAPTRPLNAYGRSKLAGEDAVRNANPNHLILRTSWVYSPFGSNFVKAMFQAANERDELRIVSDLRGSPTSALDLADAQLRLIQDWRLGKRPLPCGDTYHLAGSGDASWYELAGEVMVIREQLGLRAARLVPILAGDWPMRAVRPRYSALSSARFTRDFGFALPNWRQSVAEVVARLSRQR
jgi:dTDP-4-dehydrorhamnose reductase